MQEEEGGQSLRLGLYVVMASRGISLGLRRSQSRAHSIALLLHGRPSHPESKWGSFVLFLRLQESLTFWSRHGQLQKGFKKQTNKKHPLDFFKHPVKNLGHIYFH